MIKTVGELITELEKFPPEMEVMDLGFVPFEKVTMVTWTHDNYPYNLPDKEVVCLM